MEITEMELEQRQARMKAHMHPLLFVGGYMSPSRVRKHIKMTRQSKKNNNTTRHPPDQYPKTTSAQEATSASAQNYDTLAKCTAPLQHPTPLQLY